MASQAGSQAGDSASSQASSAVPPNSIPAREGPSQASNNPSTQAGRQAVRCSSRHRVPRGTVLPQACCTSSQEGNPPPTPNRLPQGSSLEDPNPKWVINLSSKPLIQPQRSVLAKGPNFVVSPKHPPNLEYITPIEATCTKLSQQDAEELRADINRVLRSSHPPKSNLTNAQTLALKGT